MANVHQHRARDCCEKSCGEKGNKYDTDELKSYIRKQKELRRVRELQEFEDRARILECKKQRLRELDSKCKQLATKKSTSPHQAPTTTRQTKGSPGQLSGPNYAPVPHSTKSLEKNTTGGQVTTARPKTKRPKEQQQPSGESSVRKVKSSNKLEREAADFIFREFEQIVRRECRSLLKKQGLVSASESSISLSSEAKIPRVQRERRKEKEKVLKVDKNVGTSFSLYETVPQLPPPPAPRAPKESPSRISNFSEDAKPVVSSKGFHSLIEERNERRLKIQQQRSSVPESVKNEAASKIQAAYKGYKVRSVLCEANLRGPASSHHVDQRVSNAIRSPSSDTVLQGNQMKFFRPHQTTSNLTNGVCSTTSLLQKPEKPYDQKARFPITSLHRKSLPVKPNVDEIPGYIPPPPRSTITPCRAPELSPRTVPLLRLRNPDEPFPKQVMENQTSQQNLSATSSPLKLITSISKFQLPYALQSPCSKDVPSNLLRTALKQQVEQPYKSPSQFPATTSRISRTETKDGQRPVLRSRPNVTNAISNLPDPAFSTVLQEKIKLLQNQQRLVNGTTPKKSKSPTKKSQMTAVSKATEQIKKKIVEAKQILEDYKLELLRTSPASRMSHGDDTYESDFDSESHALSQRQASLYGNDSEILSSLGDRGLELIPRPPTVGSAKEPEMNDDVSSKAETQPSSSLRGIASLKSRRSGDEVDIQESKQALEGMDQVPVREQTTFGPVKAVPGGDQIVSPTRSTKAKAREIKLELAPQVSSASEEAGPPASRIRIPSTVTLRRRDTIESEESIPDTEQQERWKTEREEDRVCEAPKLQKAPHDLEFRLGSQPAETKTVPGSGVPSKKAEEEVESEESKVSETDTDYEDLAPSVSKASTNIPTEDVNYETDFETDWQSLTQSKPHHSLIVQKGGVRQGEYDVNTQTSQSLSLTDQPASKSAAIQIDLLSDSVSMKIDQGVQSEEQTDDKLIEDEAPSISVSETPEIPTGDTKKEFEDQAVESVELSVATSVVEEEYGTDFETEVKTASVSQKPGSIVTASVPLELVSEAKDETIAEEYSGTSYKEDTFVNEESKHDIEEYPSVQSLKEDNSVSESSVVVEEVVTTTSKEVTLPKSPLEDPKTEVAPEDPDPESLEDPIEDLATSMSSNLGVSATSVIPSKVQAVEEAPEISSSDSTKSEQQKIETSVPVASVQTGRASQTEDFSHISEEIAQSQISEASFLSESKSAEKKSVSTATSQYEASKPEQVRSAQKSDALNVQSQTEKIEPETEEKFTENYSQVLNESQEIGIQAGIIEQEPPTPLRNGAKFLEDVSLQSEISEEFPESDEDEEGTEEEKDMIELAKKVDSDIFEKIESLIASEISGQFEREQEDSEATGAESRQSNFHVEDVIYASDFEADVQSEKSGDASSRRSLLETAVKQEIELLVQNVAKEEEKTGEGDAVIQRQSSPETDPVFRKVLNDQRALDLLIGRIVARMFQEVTKARREAFKTTKKSSSEVVEAAVQDDEEGSSFHGEVDGEAEWFEDDLISGGSPEDESLKREAAEIVAEQLRIENEIRALEALQAQVPATLMSLTDVPDKPPPPYSPPSSDSISLPIRPFTVQTTCKELEDLIKKQVKFLLPIWKETGNLPPSSQVEAIVAENAIDNEGNQEGTKDRNESSALLSPPSGISKGAFNSLLSDLVYELIREALLVEDEDGPHARDYVDRIRPGSLALEAQRMRIPRTEEALSNLILSKVKNLIPYPILANDVPIPRKRLTKWTSRPRDLVDEVLAEELIDEDREWTECWPEEILVLDRWAEKFARRALQEVNLAFKTAFSV